MIVFNRSNQTITYSGGNFPAGGKPVHVLPEHQEEVKTLLVKFPRHLSEGGVDSTEARKVIADKDHEISQLKEQLADAIGENEHLKLLLTDTPAAAETPAYDIKEQLAEALRENENLRFQLRHNSGPVVVEQNEQEKINAFVEELQADEVAIAKQEKAAPAEPAPAAEAPSRKSRGKQPI